jgi:hypothetical protein
MNRKGWDGSSWGVCFKAPFPEFARWNWIKQQKLPVQGSPVSGSRCKLRIFKTQSKNVYRLSDIRCACHFVHIFWFHTGVFQTVLCKMCGARCTGGEWSCWVVSLSVDSFHYLSTMLLRHMGQWRYSCNILLDLGTRWRWVVSFTPQLLYPRGKRPRYALDRRLGGPESWSGRYGERKTFPLFGFEPWLSSLKPSAVPTELSQLWMNLQSKDYSDIFFLYMDPDFGARMAQSV